MEQVGQHMWIDRVRETLQGEGRRLLIEFLQRQRWFGGKGKPLADAHLSDVIVFSTGAEPSVLAIIVAEYRGGDREHYVVPLSIRTRMDQNGESAIGELADSPLRERLCDATYEADWWKILLRGVAEGKVFVGQSGVVMGMAIAGRQDELAGPWSTIAVLSAEQSNTSVVFDQRVILKLIRRFEVGLNPEAEILEFLTTQASCIHVPPLLGLMTYDSGLTVDRYSGAVALVQRFVPNHGDGWRYTMAHLGGLVEQASIAASDRGSDLTKVVREVAGNVLSDITRLGEATGNLHLALSSKAEPEAFRPEPITDRDCEAWQREMRRQLVRVCQELRSLLPEQQSAIGLTNSEATELEAACWKRFEDLRLLARQRTVKIRHHGDYHLGQVLKTDGGFAVIDFEGEPARPLIERRAKVCPLKDVAGMLRSFNYAAHATLRRHTSVSAVDIAVVGIWERLVREAFLDGYRSVAVPGKVAFLPVSWEAALQVLRVYELDKALYELRYELRNRPDWLSIPLAGVRNLVRELAA